MDWRKLREADAKLKEVSESTRSKVFNCYNTVDDVEEDVIMDSESKDITPSDLAQFFNFEYFIPTYIIYITKGLD